MRIGFGYDVHELVNDRKLILGGVHIPYEKGLLGHSDADVLSHAIGDAIIGALGMGDIGKHFPDTWDEFKGISSMIIVKKIQTLLVNKGFVINNIDSTIVAQRPKLLDFLPDMVKTLAHTLVIDRSQLNIKATTTEGLGFAGRGDGIAAYAVVTINENDSAMYSKLKKKVVGTKKIT